MDSDQVSSSPGCIGISPQEASKFVPIAICGMACRLPGGVRSPQEFWNFLVNKGDAKQEVPASRYNIDAFYSSIKKPGSIITRQAYFIDEDLTALDGSFFNMSASEVERCDPQQRQMLEVARECLEDAGETNWRGSKTGVFMGNYGDDWAYLLDRDELQFGVHNVMGQYDFVISNRVSYEMDLKGPRRVLTCMYKTACSSSFVALNDACLSLARGDSTAAIVGGTNLMLTPKTSILLTEFGALSPDGSSKAFSADANGYARGEAIEAIYIKPLTDALRDGNPVRGVLRAVATNHDGKTPGLTTPGIDSQEALIRHSYNLAGISDYSKTGYFEMHGTGTVVGDKIESNAVARVFGGLGELYITSTKPNVGHTEGASGLTSLIKAIMSLEHRTIPPNIKFSSPNPQIPWDSAGFRVPVEPTPWPAEKLERISVNNFGIGGTSCHVILDSAASFNASTQFTEASDDPQLLTFSANSAESLERLIANCDDYLSSNPERIQDLAYTLGRKREHLPHRAFTVSSREKPGIPSASVKSSQAPSIVMVFTGQGAQWPQMGRDLIRKNTTFRTCIQSLDVHLKGLGDAAPSWTIEGELQKPARTSRVNTAELSQPLCTAIQIALVDVLAAVGVKPAAVVGHSSGEIAAAYAAGALTAEQALTAAFFRGVTVHQQQRKGAMAAIGMGRRDVERFLDDGVVVACENSPKSVTLSGDADKVEAVVTRISTEEPSVLARLLKVEKAYHSYHMFEVGQDYCRLMGSDFQSSTPIIPFFSSVTGQVLGESENLGPHYWQSNLESPVLFSTAVTAITQHSIGKNATYLEIGPHSALAGPLRQILFEAGDNASYASVLVRGQSGMESLLTAIGKLYCLRIAVDFAVLMPKGVTLPDLPRYPWDHSRKYWHESRVSYGWRQQEFKRHDLLGLRVMESTSDEPSWRNLLQLENASWLRDHSVGEDVVFPFAGYVTMAAEAIRQITGVEEGYHVRNAIATTALVLTHNEPVEIITAFQKRSGRDSQWWDFKITSYNGHRWNMHFTGEISSFAGSLGPVEIAKNESLPRKVDADRMYQMQAESGMVYGPSFQGLTELKTSTSFPGKATALVRNGKNGDESNYHLHPTLIDFSIQLVVVGALLGLSNNYKVFLATSVADLKVLRSFADFEAVGHAKFDENGGMLGECQYIADGQVILSMSGFGLTEKPNRGPLNSHASVRHVWKPHLDFLSPTGLIKPVPSKHQGCSILKELTDLSLAYSNRCFEEKEVTAPHLQKYRAWIRSQVMAIDSSSMLHWSEITLKSLLEMMKVQVRHLGSSDLECAAQAILQVCENLSQVISDDVDVADILQDQDLHNRVWDLVSKVDVSEFMSSLAHTKPNLRVLELGAGSGIFTVGYINSLAGSFQKYDFTDSTTVHFDEVKKMFKSHLNFSTTLLDIGKPLDYQGFEGKQYDLVIANNVLSTSSSLQNTLKNILGLLSPSGRLLVQEISSNINWAGLIFGASPGWFKIDKAGQPYERSLNTATWSRELSDAGFTVDTAYPQAQESEDATFCSALLARLKIEPQPVDIRITLLVEHLTPSIEVENVTRTLQSKGYIIDRITLEDVPAPEQDIISLLDLERPFIADISDTDYSKLKSFLENIKGSGLFWPTKLSQVQVTEPTYGLVVGLARTVRNELDVDFAICQTDLRYDDPNVLQVFEKFRADQADEAFKREMEYVVANGQILVGRYFSHAMAEQLLTSKSNDTIELALDRVGRLKGLYWQRQEAVSLKDDSVEVEVYAAGLGQNDVFAANGTLQVARPVLGREIAGVVKAVGSRVKSLLVGDRVLALASTSAASSIISPASSLIKIPEHLSFVKAASIPLAYAAAIYSLLDVGGLKKGQTVLISVSASDVRSAAIQVSRLVEASIFIVVETEEEASNIACTFNLPHDRVLTSVSEINLGSQGADVVIVSTAGESLRVTWPHVAEFGLVVNVGMNNTITNANEFPSNRTYMHADIERLSRSKPATIQRLLERAVEMVARVEVGPVNPIRTFPASEVQEAIKYMQDGTHTGKVVLELRKSAEHTHITSDIAVARTRMPQFKANASYLVVGGLGGLGRSVATWMVGNGAQELILLSRSAGKRQEDLDLKVELESMGSAVHLVQGSVVSFDDVKKAVSVPQNPLHGVLQMSMVLRDGIFTNMTHQDWVVAVDCKVAGTWNLHNATVAANSPLDFFVMFSSVSGIVGNPGQANYNSANTFLDAFAQYRAGLGLAGCVLNCGVVQDVGVVAANQEILRRFREQDIWTIREQDVLDGLTLACSKRRELNTRIEVPNGTHTKRVSKAPANVINNQDRANGVNDLYKPSIASTSEGFVSPDTVILGLATTTPLQSTSSRAVFRTDPRMASFHNIPLSADGISTAAASSGDGDAALKSFVSRAKSDSSVLESTDAAKFVATGIGQRVSALLMRGGEDDAVNLGLGLADLGVDSLLAIDLRAWWRGVFGFEVGVLEMLGMGTLEALGGLAVKKLKGLGVKS